MVAELTLTYILYILIFEKCCCIVLDSTRNMIWLFYGGCVVTMQPNPFADDVPPQILAPTLRAQSHSIWMPMWKLLSQPWLTWPWTQLLQPGQDWDHWPPTLSVAGSLPSWSNLHRVSPLVGVNVQYLNASRSYKWRRPIIHSLHILILHTL